MQAQQLDEEVQAHLRNTEHIAAVDDGVSSALLVAAQDEIAALQQKLAAAQPDDVRSPNFNTTAVACSDSPQHDASGAHQRRGTSTHAQAAPSAAAQRVCVDLQTAHEKNSREAPRVRVRLRVVQDAPEQLAALQRGIADSLAALQRVTGQYNRACNKLAGLKAALQGHLADTAEAAASRHSTEGASSAGQRSRRGTTDSAASFASTDRSGSEALSPSAAQATAGGAAPVAAASRVLVRSHAIAAGCQGAWPLGVHTQAFFALLPPCV